MLESAQSEGLASVGDSPSMVLVLLGLIVLAGMLCALERIRTLTVQVRDLNQELGSLRDESGSQGAPLDEARGEIARLRRVPEAEMLPMLQLAHEMRSPGPLAGCRVLVGYSRVCAGRQRDR